MKSMHDKGKFLASRYKEPGVLGVTMIPLVLSYTQNWGTSAQVGSRLRLAAGEAAGSAGASLSRFCRSVRFTSPCRRSGPAGAQLLLWPPTARRLAHSLSIATCSGAAWRNFVDTVFSLLCRSEARAASETLQAATELWPDGAGVLRKTQSMPSNAS